MSTITKEQHDELCVSYASMILFDGEAEITADAIHHILHASNNEVEPYWPALFAGLLSKEGKILELIAAGGPSSGGAAAGAPGAAAGGAEEAPKEEEKKEEEEEAVSGCDWNRLARAGERRSNDWLSDLGGGMDMFGGEADY
ncbi:hypothetical protein BBJ28_00017019 [Nothophytophthora sp. Chile5]|nr:hypothetical protein BBJ28_00017019 [Nothophytophthora sp. Chile5]